MGKESSWDTTSGLLEEYTFKVKEAWFGPNEESDRSPDKIYLNLRGEAYVDGDLEDDEHIERYSVGKNWEVVEDGAEVENATGKNRFNENTGIGRLINALVACGDDVAAYLADRGEAYEADTFSGLNMDMERMLVSEFESDDGETVRWFLSLPVDVKTKKAKKAKKGGSGKASRGKGKGKTKKVASGLRSDIIDFAREFDEDEHDEFVDQILDEDVFSDAGKIEDDDELHAEVLDPESELWAEAH